MRKTIAAGIALGLGLGAAMAPAATAHTVTVVMGVESVQAISADRLIGAPVVNLQEEPLGEVEDLIIGVDDHARYVVISVGGFLDIADRLVAVPYSEAKTRDDGVVLVDATRDSLESMPEFSYGTGDGRDDYMRRFEA